MAGRPRVAYYATSSGGELRYIERSPAEWWYPATTADTVNVVGPYVGSLKKSGIVLDIKMREYSGLDLLQHLRKKYYDLPVILNSAYSSFKVDLKAVAADYYVVKSSDLSELKEKLKIALETRIPK